MTSSARPRSRRGVHWLAPVVVAFAASHASATAIPGSVRTLAQGDDMRIEFTHPTDFRCATRGVCIHCTNVTGATSRLAVRQGDTRDGRTHDVPPGATLELCGE